MEVLALLRAGKGNKDIAKALGIGLGTVKQHVVALYRRLNVSSRAAAIAQTTPSAERTTGAAITAADDGLLELRPTSVLSVAVVAGTEADFKDSWPAFQQCVVKAIANHDCTMVSRPGSGIDLILGLHRAGRRDCFRAVEIAHQIRDTLRESERANGRVTTIRAGLSSGFLVASMARHGGWTGEKVAGRSIARARELRETAEADTILTDVTSRELLGSDLGIAELDETDGNLIDLAARPAKRAPLAAPDSRHKLVGREPEMAVLNDALMRAKAGAGSVIAVLGEAGIGKTALCQAFGAQAAMDASASWVECRCGDGLFAALSGLERGQGRPPRFVGADDALAGVTRYAAKGAALLFVDDIEQACGTQREFLADLADLASGMPLLVILAGQRTDMACIHLPLKPLSDAHMRALLDDPSLRGLMEPQKEHALRLAAGIPFYALQLARAAIAAGPGRMPPHPPLALICAMASKIDMDAIDRSFIHLIAGAADRRQDKLAAAWQGQAEEFDLAVDAAINAKIIVRSAKDGTLSFTHPLLEEVARFTMLCNHSGLETFRAVAMTV